MSKYFTVKDTLYEITEKYEESINLFASIGFKSILDNNLREKIGKSITLEDALKLKKIDSEVFEKRLNTLIEETMDSETELVERRVGDDATIKIEGVLPCPVRVPLMESFQKFIADNEVDESTIQYELKAASMGVDWLKESLEKENSTDAIADIFISAGFDLFFDRNLIGKYRDDGVFEDLTDLKKYNTDFNNEKIRLRDPDHEYSMIGVVPAVFLVNTDELEGRSIPTSWDELLSPEYENKVSLPIGDFDLFNAILLNIYAKYGEKGIERLGKSLLRSMHPSEMVKSHLKKVEKPIVTIMPYFFTKMTLHGGPMKAIWPSDGAIISPIFMLTKKEKADKLKPFADFFSSKEVGEILSHNGRFPSVNPEVDNQIPEDNQYMWLGWDYIKENNIGDLIKKCETIFNKSI